MILKHPNPTQTVPSNGFLPLMQNEIPYFSNLNRPAQSAYAYADAINSYISYGGHISILQPGIDATQHTFSLYEVALITDEELLMPADPTAINSINNRYGIVVVEATIDPTTNTSSNIVVLTFCPNFVYPDNTVSQVWGTSAGTPLYLSTSASGVFLSSTKTNKNNDNSQIGSIPIAIQTGVNSIFFCGTYRMFAAPASPLT